MNYRLATKDDEAKIFRFCDDHNLPHPILNICFIAETDDGQIAAYCNAGYIGFLESFGLDNPVAGHTIHAMVEGALKVNGIAPIFAGVINPEAGKLLERLGYEEVKDTQFYLRRK